MAAPSNPLYSWKIRCIDRQTKKMFDREVVFSPALASDAAELQEVTVILEDAAQRRRVSYYRHLFEEVTADELMQRANVQQAGAFFCVPDYFEDEGGNPLDVSDLVAIQQGLPNAVILGDVKSVLKLGVSPMRHPELWVVQDSNDFIHLLQILGLISQSRWFQTKLSLSTVGSSGLYELEAPDLDSTTSALALIRQFLMQRDDVFKEVAKLYMQQVDCEVKRVWVQAEVDSFTRFLVATTMFGRPDELSGLSNGELIETLIYGTGLFHRQSNANLEEKLAELQQPCNREQLMFALDSACRQLLVSPMTSYPLLYRDFAHWTNSGMCPRPTRVVLNSLFGPSKDEK